MRLRYTIAAAGELDRILAYLEARSPTGARQVGARIKAVTTLLLQQPLAGRLTSTASLRRIAVSPYPYLIFYQVTDTDVVIHAVRHAAREPSSMPGS